MFRNNSIFKNVQKMLKNPENRALAQECLEQAKLQALLSVSVATGLTALGVIKFTDESKQEDSAPSTPKFGRSNSSSK